MVKFKDLFQFSQREVSDFFNRSKLHSKTFGLRLLQVQFAVDNIKPNFGKLLVITPRACGKAHERNLLRRRLKNIFYQRQLYKTPNVSIVIVTKNAMLLSYNQLKDFLVKCID